MNPTGSKIPKEKSLDEWQVPADTVCMAMKKSDKVKMSQRIRAEIKGSTVSRYRIGQKTGIEESALSRFMSGKRGLSMEALDALFEYFDLDVVRRGRKG